MLRNIPDVLVGDETIETSVGDQSTAKYFSSVNRMTIFFFRIHIIFLFESACLMAVSKYKLTGFSTWHKPIGLVGPPDCPLVHVHLLRILPEGLVRSAPDLGPQLFGEVWRVALGPQFSFYEENLGTQYSLPMASTVKPAWKAFTTSSQLYFSMLKWWPG